jgi:hypothetical protein
MERSVIRDGPFPDYAALHPGYSFHQRGSGGSGPSGTMLVGLSALIE